MGKNTVINVPPGRLTITGLRPEVRLVYLAAATQAATQEEADEILAVAEKLKGLNRRELYLAAHDENQPVAELIGGSSVRDSTLKVLAKYELEERKKNRSDWKHNISIISGWLTALIAIGVAIYLALNK